MPEPQDDGPQFIVEGEEQTSDNNEVDVSEETSDALEASESAEHPTTQETEESDTSVEDLKTNLEKQTESARDLGHVSSATVKTLLEKAQQGDETAIELIEGNERVSEYAKKKFKDDYKEFRSSRRETKGELNADEITEKIKTDLKRDRNIEDIESEIRKTGVKSDNEFETIKRNAIALHDAGEKQVKNAVSAAYFGLKGESPTTQPIIKSGGGDVTTEKKIVITEAEITALQSQSPYLTRDNAIKVVKLGHANDSNFKYHGTEKKIVIDD